MRNGILSRELVARKYWRGALYYTLAIPHPSLAVIAHLQLIYTSE